MLTADAMDYRAPTTTMKSKTLARFGSRLAAMRQRRDLTQAEPGKAVGVFQRVIAYYEGHSAQPPGALLADLAHALRVSADELLGVKPVIDKVSPKTAWLLKRLRRVQELPPADQRAVLTLVDAMLDTRARTQRPSRTKSKAS